jgi:hypothetical protein
MDEETFLRIRLAELHQDYLERCQPFFKRLAAIESLKPPKPFFITKEQAIEFNLLPKEPKE